MKFFRKSLLLLVLATVLLAGTAPADADCTQTGVIANVLYNSTSSYAICYVASGAYPTFNYVFQVTDPQGTGAVVLDLLNAAMVGGLKVQITGNAASCPSSGAYRTGGFIKSLKLYAD